MIGAAIAVVAGSRERLFPAFGAGSVVYGVPVAATGLVPPLAPTLLGASGAGGELFDVTGRTMLQRLIPDHKLTRSLRVLESAYMGAEGIGAFSAAILVSALGPGVDPRDRRGARTGRMPRPASTARRRGRRCEGPGR